MKKFVILALVLVISCVPAFSQSRYGFTGGVNFSYPSQKNAEGKYDNAVLYHGGFTYQYKIAMGFAVQPSLLFSMKGAAKAENPASVRLGSIMLPVGFQWGPDLLLFRPYVQVTPFAGVNVYDSGNFDRTKMEWGVGLGGGIEIWKCQLAAHYYWNINPYCKGVEGMEPGWSFRCTMLSLSFLF